MTHPKDPAIQSSVSYEGRLLSAFPISEGGAPVRDLIHRTLHGRYIEARAEALVDLLDYLGVFGPVPK